MSNSYFQNIKRRKERTKTIGCKLKENKNSIIVYNISPCYISFGNEISSEDLKAKKKYSLSLIQNRNYNPLSIDDKMDIINDLDTESSKRMKHYYSLFGDIKNKLKDINDTISERNKKPKKLNLNLMEREDVIIEQEKEDVITPINENQRINLKKGKLNYEIYLRHIKTNSSDIYDFINNEEDLSTEENNREYNKHIQINSSEFKCFPKESLGMFYNTHSRNRTDINDFQKYKNNITKIVTSANSINYYDTEDFYNEIKINKTEEDNSQFCYCKCGCSIY